MLGDNAPGMVTPFPVDRRTDELVLELDVTDIAAPTVVYPCGSEVESGEIVDFPNESDQPNR